MIAVAGRVGAERCAAVQRGAGPWPPEALLVTTTPCPPCAPQRTQITAVLHDSIRVHWGAPACVDPIVTTEAQLGASEGAHGRGAGVHWRTVYRGDGDGCTLTRLQAGRPHQLRVRHKSEGGWGAWSKALAVRGCCCLLFVVSTRVSHIARGARLLVSAVCLHMLCLKVLRTLLVRSCPTG